MVVGLAVMGETEGAAADISFSFGNVLILFGVGIIASATMVIPGVSGSMVLMLMGFYYPVLNAVKDFFKALAAFSYPLVWVWWQGFSASPSWWRSSLKNFPSMPIGESSDSLCPRL